jgi:hypothetical protein
MSRRRILLAAVAAFGAFQLLAESTAWLDAIERAVKGEGILQKFPPAPAPRGEMSGRQKEED